MNITAEQIQEWKAKYGGVWEFPVDDKTAYLRDPDMLDFKRAFNAMQTDGDVGFGEALLDALFIGGDEEVRKDDAYFIPARKKLISFFNYDDAELTPLPDSNQTKITIGDHSCIVRVITRQDLKTAERKNPSGKPFVTSEQLFDLVCIEKDEAFKDKRNAEIRFPLYKAIEELQNQKVASIKKL